MCLHSMVAFVLKECEIYFGSSSLVCLFSGSLVSSSSHLFMSVVKCFVNHFSCYFLLLQVFAR